MRGRFWLTGEILYMNEDTTGRDGGKKIGVLGDEALEHLRIQEALKESEAKFRVLGDATPTAVMLYQDNRFIYMNKSAERISGYSAAELYNINYWGIVHPDYRALVEERGLKRQNSEETISRYEFKIIAKDGTEKWVDLAGASTMIGGGPPGLSRWSTSPTANGWRRTFANLKRNTAC